MISVSAIYGAMCRKSLVKSPYSTQRVGHILSHLQSKSINIGQLFTILSTVLLWFSAVDECTSYLLTWFGLVPNQVVFAGLMTALAITFMPRRPDDSEPLVKVLLQETAWTEANVATQLGVRRIALNAMPHEAGAEDEPVFCWETVMKAFHWAFLSYRYEEHKGDDAAVAHTDEPDALVGPNMPEEPRLEAGLQLYGLTFVKVLRETKHDTKLLAATGPSAVLLAFRGTASTPGWLADVQAWQARHPRQPVGTSWPSLIHSGFLKVWMEGNLRAEVLALVKDAVTASHVPAADMRILITGHSLGGALATLAAYDLTVELQELGLQVQCITFGAPRVGNSIFVADYNRHVPNTWHVINDQDTVSVAGKFVRMYRRTGHRVIVNERGDLIVRPLPLEHRLLPIRAFGLGRVKDHWLSSYARSLLRIMEMQFRGKGAPGGATGVVAMIEGNPALKRILESSEFRLNELLEHAGYSVDSIAMLARESMRTEEILLPPSPTRSQLPNDRGIFKCWRKKHRHESLFDYRLPFT